MTPEKVVQNAIIAYFKKLKDEGKPVILWIKHFISWG